jgi:pimeloyl-ACP methyl ester carboxylesterase
MIIVLVHGAWSGSWSWKPVAQGLRQRGFEVYAPNLSGVGARSHIPPDCVDLTTHIEDITGLLRFEDLKDVLLVGHSYGGMVVTGAADREIERISKLVYLDAFLPESGQSLWNLLGPEAAGRQHAAAEKHDNGRSVPANVLPRDEAVSRSRPPLTAQPIKTLSEPWVSVRSRQTWPPRHYISCRDTPMPVFRTTAEHVKGTAGWTVEEFAAAHDVPLTHPELVTATIAGLAGMAGTDR